MKTSVLSLALAATLVAATPVLAQDAPTTTEQPAKPKADKKRLFKSGAIGCVTGGALAYLTGKKDKPWPRVPSVPRLVPSPPTRR
jgi:hypothetical protein